VQDVVAELGRYILGWLGYFGISHTYRVLLELEEWVRRRVRLYYWKQWKRPGTRRRHLMALGISKERVKLASRSRKGLPTGVEVKWSSVSAALRLWRMSGNSVVQCALTNAWLKEQGVPDMRAKWVALHYPDQQGV